MYAPNPFAGLVNYAQTGISRETSQVARFDVLLPFIFAFYFTKN